MDIRVCFRVRERRDVDLILGQGMLNVGWRAHTLNAPGKFLVSAPEHTTPNRARAYLVTDQTVSDTAARHAVNRPELDEESHRAINAETIPEPPEDEDRSPDASQPERAIDTTAEDALWFALCAAPDAGSDIGELMNIAAMTRPTLYRHLGQHAKAGRAIQVSRGRWRAVTSGEPSP